VANPVEQLAAELTLEPADAVGVGSLEGLGDSGAVEMWALAAGAPWGNGDGGDPTGVSQADISSARSTAQMFLSAIF